MGIFGRSKKKKQKQQALLKAKQREAAEAAEAKRASEALKTRQAELRSQEEEKKEENEEPIVGKEDDTLNKTIDTAEENDRSLEENPADDDDAVPSSKIATPSAEEPMETAASGDVAAETAEEAPVAENEETADANAAAPSIDTAWTPFEADPFASSTYEKWKFQSEGDSPKEDSAANAEDESGEDGEEDLEVETAEENKENKDGTEDQPPIVGAERETTEDTTDKITVAVEGEETKAEATFAATEEPAFDSQHAFQKAKGFVNETAVTIGLAASTAYTMATACVGDIQAGFSDDITDHMSVGTRDTRGTLDDTTVESRGNSYMDTTYDSQYTDDDGSTSRASRNTYDSRYSKQSRGSRGTYDDETKATIPEEEEQPSRYRRYDDTQFSKDDASRASKDDSGSRTSHVRFQEPKDAAPAQQQQPDAPAALPTVFSQDEAQTDVDSALDTVLATNISTGPTNGALGGTSPEEPEESLDDVLDGTHSDVPSPSIPEKQEANVQEPQAAAIAEEYDGSGEFYSLEDLQKRPDGTDDTSREMYLSPKDFETHFGMSKLDFAQMPKWKRDSSKKRLSLF